MTLEISRVEIVKEYKILIVCFHLISLSSCTMSSSMSLNP